MKTKKQRPKSNIGIIDNFEVYDRSLQSIFFSYYVSKLRSPPKCYLATLGKTDPASFSYKWDQHIYNLNNKKNYEIAGWSLNFDLCVWYVSDIDVLNSIKESNPKCEHVYVADYYNFSENQQNFCKKMNYILVPSEQIKMLYMGFLPEHKILVTPPDILFMNLLPAKRWRLTKVKDNKKVVVVNLTDTINLTSPEIIMLLSMLDVIPDLSLIFLTYNDKIKETDFYKQIKDKYKNRISFRINPYDFDIIQLSEKPIYYFIDFNKTNNYGSLVSIFRNAGIPVLCYELPVLRDININNISGYYLPCKLQTVGVTESACNEVNDKLLTTLFKILSNEELQLNLLKSMDLSEARTVVKAKNYVAMQLLLPTQGDLTRKRSYDYGNDSITNQGNSQQDLLNHCFYFRKDKYDEAQ